MMNLKILILLFEIQLNVLASGIFNGDKRTALSSTDPKEKVVTEKYFNYKNGYDDDDYDPGNPDYYEFIERPCPVFDIFCIRKFFAEHSKCKIVPGPVREPFYVAENQLYMANSNITTTVTNVLFSGLNGRIEEFYVNKETGNLVLSVFFEGIKSEANPTYLRFNRNGQEPVEVRAIAAIDYAKTSVTVVIPNYKNLRLENAEVNGYLDSPESPFSVIPLTLERTADPTVVAETAALIADAATAVIENLPTVAPLVANIFIQNNICDFGVPISRL